MRAVALDYETRSLNRLDLPEPEPPGPDEVLFRVLATGVCGTDRDLAEFRFGHPPPGERHLVLGHEALGQVVAAGSAGSAGLKPGDWVAPMVRRACAPACMSCARGRRDLCLTGGYTERGIIGRSRLLLRLCRRSPLGPGARAAGDCRCGGARRTAQCR